MSRLQVLGDFRGLNFTSAVFSVLSKYTAGSTTIDTSCHPRKKLGYFQTEKHVVDLVRNETGTGNARHPLTFLVEASDDICYLLVDIEDAIKKRVIRWSDVCAALESVPCSTTKALLEKVESFAKEVGSLHTDSSLDEAKAQYFRVLAIGKGMESVVKCFFANYGDIKAGKCNLELLFSSEISGMFGALKKFCGKKVYTSKETLRLEILGFNVISSLLNMFSSADKNAKGNSREGKLYQLISQNYRLVYENPEPWENSFPEDYRKTMLITDYICGMTDSFALRLNHQLLHGDLP